MNPLIPAGAMATSSILQGFIGQANKKNEEAIDKYNAKVLRRKAVFNDRLTKFRSVRQAEEAARIMGEKEAAIGGSGLVSTEGAPMMALALQKSELDLQNYLLNLEGRKTSEELESQAQTYDIAASQARRGANQALVGGFLGAGASAIQTYAMWPKQASGTTWNQTKEAMNNPYWTG